MTQKQHFTPPTLTIPEQITLLRSRGLNVPDTEKAAHYLSFIGYYRLSGYLPPLMAGRSRFKLLKTIAPDSHWSKRLSDLFAEYPTMDITQMGFLKDWNDFKAPQC